MNYYIKADRFLLENGERTNAYLQVIDGKFGPFVSEPPAEVEIRDFTGFTVAPGLFDTHIHGIAGHDFMDGTVETVHEISKALPKTGVTRFLATTLTSAPSDLERAIQAIKEAEKQGLPGAQSEGIFLEGPYFTEKYKGAQSPDFFRDPDLDEFRRWQELAEGSIVKMALAPERSGAFEFIRRISRDSVLVGLAHTDADYDCCKKAVAAGARLFVHLFNGMRGLHHREPGVAGAALAETDTYAELICDGHHVHPAVAKLAYRIKGDKLVLITDCMRAGLMPDGEYTLGDYPVKVVGGMAKTESGALAGSTLTLLDAIKNLYAWTQEPLYKIWHLASLSPAASLKKDHKLGSIKQGKTADYVIIDQNLQIHTTSINGRDMGTGSLSQPGL